MKDETVVAIAIATLGTVLGCVQMVIHGNGYILSSMIGLYGTILGYFFGKKKGEEVKQNE